MKKTHIVIISLVVVISVFVKFAPNIKTLIEINQYEKTEIAYSKKYDDALLAKLVFEAADRQYYYKLQEYGEIFFESRNPYSACDILEDYLLLNNHNIEYESVEELYDIILWQYLITYFYDFETSSLTNITYFLERYDRLNNNFIGDYEKEFEMFSNGVLCTSFFAESDLLRERFINALNVYWLLYDETYAYDIVYFSAMEANSPGLNDLYMDIILFESGKDLWKTNHITVTDDLNNAIVCGSSIEFVERNSYISEVADFFEVKLNFSELESQDCFVFSTNQYAYVFFGKNTSIFMCYDLIAGDLIEYKSSNNKDQSGDGSVTNQGIRNQSGDGSVIDTE